MEFVVARNIRRFDFYDYRYKACRNIVRLFTKNMPPDNPINTIIHLQEHLPKSYEFKKETSSSHGVALTRNNRDQFICLSGEFADGVDFHCELTEEISASCDGKFKNEKIANFQMRDLCSYR